MLTSCQKSDHVSWTASAAAPANVGGNATVTATCDDPSPSPCPFAVPPVAMNEITCSICIL